MNNNLTEKIRNDFDRLALYDREGWNHNNHYHYFLLKHLPIYCQTVLDLGCGTGEFSRLLAQRADQVVAIDLSPNMISVAQQRSRQYTNIDFQVANILQWQFPLEQFDAILLIATLHHLPIEDFIPKVKTALKPGGKLIVLDLLKYENLQDSLSDLIAVPLNWIFQLLKNSHVQQSPEALEAMREHLRTDEYLTLSQARRIYTSLLKGAIIKKHLLWRYSMVWKKPIAPE